jgi:hypothetical protein
MPSQLAPQDRCGVDHRDASCGGGTGSPSGDGDDSYARLEESRDITWSLWTAPVNDDSPDAMSGGLVRERGDYFQNSGCKRLAQVHDREIRW